MIFQELDELISQTQLDIAKAVEVITKPIGRGNEVSSETVSFRRHRPEFEHPDQRFKG